MPNEPNKGNMPDQNKGKQDQWKGSQPQGGQQKGGQPQQGGQQGTHGSQGGQRNPDQDRNR